MPTSKIELFPYQVDDVDRMVEETSMLVAYDMGTGKTVMSLAACEELMDAGVITLPVLILCSKSLKGQWAQSIAKFTESRSIVIDGGPAQRDKQYELLGNWESEGIDYVIANYDQIVSDKPLRRRWGALVVDEATALKGLRTQRSKVVKSVGEYAPVRLALTGTPVENGRPEELFSIMQFVDPTVLGPWYPFENRYILRNPWGGVSGYRNLDELHTRIQPFMIRKSASDPDVAPYMPTLIHREPLVVKMDARTAKLYRLIADDLLSDLQEVVETGGSSFYLAAHYGEADQQASQGDRLRGSLMSKITALRMLCDHPELLRISAAKYNGSGAGGSEYAAYLQDAGLLVDGRSAKLEATVDYISDFLEEDPDHKVVVFSSYVDMLPMLATRLEKFGCVQYTGSMSTKVRDANKEKFQTDKDTRVFISSDAGGYGVDLPQANLLVNYSLPWSAGAYEQRNARIRRASSEWKHIAIQDVLLGGSIDERIFDLLQDKKGVQSAIVDGTKQDKDGGFKLTAGSLRAFLKAPSG